MTIPQSKDLLAAVLVSLLAISCAPQPRTETASDPSPTTVPVVAKELSKRRVTPSPIATAVDAAAKGAVTPGAVAEVADLEQDLSKTLAKANGVEVSRRKALLTVRLRGEAGFASNSAAIGQELYAAVERIASVLHDSPRTVLRVEGHTDSLGSESHNLELSERRAEAVKNLLEQLGIDSSRLEARGLGEAQPVAANGDEEGRKMNRRIEIRVAPVSQ